MEVSKMFQTITGKTTTEIMHDFHKNVVTLHKSVYLDDISSDERRLTDSIF